MSIARRSMVLTTLALIACGGSSESDLTNTPTDDASTSADSSTDTSEDASTNDSSVLETDGGADSGPRPGIAYAIAYAGTAAGIGVRTALDSSFATTGLTMYKASEDERPEIGSNTNRDFYSNGTLMIGRWAGGKTGGKFAAVGGTGLIDIPVNGGFHYAVGLGIGELPSSGKVNYALAHATSVTQADGTVAPGTLTGSLAANFAGAASKIGFNLALQIGSASYNLQTSGGSADPNGSNVTINALPKYSFTSNITNMTGPLCGDAGGTCSAGVYGVVGGTNDDAIGIVVHIYQGTAGSPTSLSVAAEFQKQ